jgi:hypothetical protein
MENIITNYNKLNFDDNGAGTSVALSTLQTRVQAGATDPSYYGATYAIVFNDYVLLNSNGSTPPIADGTGNNRTLRVSIAKESQTLTTLFTK